MPPTNATERNKAFRNFLIFFIITVAIIVATVFFSIEVNAEENKQLKEYKENVEKEKDFSEQFETTMNSTVRLLDSLNDKQTNPELVGDKIKENLRAMDEMIAKDSMGGKGLYEVVTAHLNQLYVAKEELREATNKDDTQTELKQQVEDLKRELDKCKNQVDIYKILQNRD